MKNLISQLLDSSTGIIPYDEFKDICDNYEGQYFDAKSLWDFRELVKDNTTKQQLRNKIRNDISKDISGFANTNGGIIAYGVKEDKENRLVEIESEGVSDNIISGTLMTWFSRIVGDVTDPPVQSFCIKKIDHLKNKDECYYLIVIDDSEFAPHQALDKKYYGRFDDQTIALPDKYVRDIMNRQILGKPKLEVNFHATISPPNISPPRPINMLISVKAMTTNEIVIRNCCLIEIFNRNVVEIRTPNSPSMHRRVHTPGRVSLYQNCSFVYPEDEYIFHKIDIELKGGNDGIEDFIEFKFVSTNSRIIKKLYRIVSNGLGYVSLFDESCDLNDSESYLWHYQSEGPRDQCDYFVDWIE